MMILFIVPSATVTVVISVTKFKNMRRTSMDIERRQSLSDSLWTAIATQPLASDGLNAVDARLLPM
jgi:hypothetical protein